MSSTNVGRVLVPREGSIYAANPIRATDLHSGGFIRFDHRPVTDSTANPRPFSYTPSKNLEFRDRYERPSAEYKIKAPLLLSPGHVTLNRGLWEEYRNFEPDGSYTSYKPEGDGSEQSLRSTGGSVILASHNPVGSNNLHLFGDGTFDLGLSSEECKSAFTEVAKHLWDEDGLN